MTHLTLVPAKREPLNLIDEAIARFGARRVLIAAALAALRPRPRRTGAPAGGLTDHLRRDVGLPPVAAERIHPWL